MPAEITDALIKLIHQLLRYMKFWNSAAYIVRS